MGKSKSGGTRSYIRGRVGADVYSVGRDAKGKKQQVVRSLAETVANPQTQSQMRGRMIMSTVMQAASALMPIIDHSFDEVTGRQPNISEFVARNYKLIKADVATNPASNNAFGLNKYQEKGVKRGAYIIADGKASIPAALVLTKASGVIAITMPSDNITIGGLKSALGMTSDEYFTLVGITVDGKANYERFRVNPSLADSTAISSSNIANVFAVEGNTAATISVASNVISISMNSVANCCEVIVSLKTVDGYRHNKAILGSVTGIDFNADTALPTYPVGAQDYLNGGDILGQSESFNPGGGDTPTPSPTQRSISAAVVNGASLSAAGSATLIEGSNTIVATIPATGDESAYAIAIADKATYNVGHAAPAGATAVNAVSMTLSTTAAENDAAKTIVLCKDGAVIQTYGTLNAPSSAPVTDAAVIVDGVSHELGSTVTVTSRNPTIVVSVPNGNAMVGKRIMASKSRYDDSAASAGETLIAGNNTVNLSGMWNTGNDLYIGCGTFDEDDMAEWSTQIVHLQIS